MVDIGGTKKRIQRLMNVAEESYKKVSELLERMEKLQNDLETTSDQVDHIEYEVAEQRVLLEAIAEAQGLDVNELLGTSEPDEILQLDDEEGVVITTDAAADSGERGRQTDRGDGDDQSTVTEDEEAADQETAAEEEEGADEDDTN